MSDKTVIIRDYKTKIPIGKKIDEFGDIVSMKSLFNKRDNKKHKYQIGTYGSILQNSFGFKGVRSSAIIPVILSVPLSKGVFSKTVSNVRFPGQDKLLEQVRPFAEKTGFNSLDEFIQNIQTRITFLEEKINKTKDKQEKQRLTDRIDGLNAGKKDILINHSLNKIVKYAQDLNDELSSRTR